MRYLLIFFLFLLNSCSFDNKTGIWNNENNIVNKNKNIYEEFKTLSSNQVLFDKTIPFKKNFQFKKFLITENSKWRDIFYDETNNFKNYKLKEKNQDLFKSRKISKYETSDYILLDNKNIFTNDIKGNLIIFSILENNVLQKYNFYKKKYKKIEKKLNIALDKNILFVSDNLGYLYSYDYNANKILWAKNFKIPFRSNLKLLNNKIIAANQNNDLFFLDKYSGEVLKTIPTEENQIKNEFVSNISSSKDISLFLNTYGSLYAINNENMKIIWFINLNQSLDLNPSNLFEGNQIINDQEKVIVTSNRSLYVIDIFTGKINLKKNFSSSIKPMMISDYLFVITKNDFLVCVNLRDGNIIYSYNLNQLIADYYNVKKRKAEFKSLIMANNKILIFLKNSYLLKFNISGILEEVIKLPTKLKTQPIIVNKSILYLDKNKKLSILN